jgi:hypothetical protein
MVSERFLRVWHMQNQPVELPGGRSLPDVFGGQVLALHAASGFFMKDPALCAAAGRFFSSDAYERVFVLGQADSCPQYWELVRGIVIAGHLYAQAAREQKKGRGVREQEGGEHVAVVASAEALSHTSMLEDLAVHEHWVCASCCGELRYIGFDHADGSDSAELKFSCRNCEAPTRREVCYHELHVLLTSSRP